MKIMIDDVKLHLLLEQKKEFIGKNVVWDSLLSAISFLVSVLLASYEDFLGIPGIIFKTIFVLLGVFFTAKSLKDIYDSKKNNYSYEDLLRDINKLNEIAHGHSIVLVKDTFRKFPNRFLVYDDKRWECLLFLKYKQNPDIESFIRNRISSELKIEPQDMDLSYLGQRIHEKYSESAKKNKVYCHRFYMASIRNYPEEMRKDSFQCDGKEYRWMTLDELEQDDNVRKKNSDILNYVKEMA